MVRNSILGLLPIYNGEKKMLVKVQDTKDIIKQLIDAHKKYAEDYDKISLQFWKGNVENTCRYIYKFLKNNVKYTIEPDNSQSVKSPAAIIATGFNGKNDCKHYSQFFAGVLDSLRRKGKDIDWCFRFANYRLFTTEPQHVFVVVKDKGKELWCDCVLNYFNEKKSYFNKIDKKTNMALYSISGIGATLPNPAQYKQILLAKNKKKGVKGLTKAQNIQVTQYGAQLYVKQQNRLAEKRDRWKNPIQKIALLPARNAYLALVGLNAFNLAKRLLIAIGKNPVSVKSKWQKAGGQYEKLYATVQHGIKNARGNSAILNYQYGVKPLPKYIVDQYKEQTDKNLQAQAIQYQAEPKPAQIGFLHGVVAAAAPVVAAPVLKIMGQVLKFGGKVIKTGAKIAPVVQKGAEVAQQVLDTAQTAQGLYTQGKDIVEGFKGGGNNTPDVPNQPEPVNVDEGGKVENTPGNGKDFNFKKLLIPAAILGGVLLISKK